MTEPLERFPEEGEFLSEKHDNGNQVMDGLGNPRPAPIARLSLHLGAIFQGQTGNQLVGQTPDLQEEGPESAQKECVVVVGHTQNEAAVLTEAGDFPVLAHGHVGEGVGLGPQLPQLGVPLLENGRHLLEVPGDFGQSFGEVDDQTLFEFFSQVPNFLDSSGSGSDGLVDFLPFLDPLGVQIPDLGAVDGVVVGETQDDTRVDLEQEVQQLHLVLPVQTGDRHLGQIFMLDSCEEGVGRLEELTGVFW